MGSFLSQPKTEKTNDSGCGNGLTFATAEMQGWRVDMEDAHTCVIGLPYALKEWSFFGVFDGHAGSRVSKVCSERLLDVITSTKHFKGSHEPKPPINPPIDDVKEAMRTGFLQFDEELRQLPEVKSGEEKSGSTAVTLLVTPEYLVFANCGDSRAILCRDGVVAFNTKDHKPNDKEETMRIEKAGGNVVIQRVNGSLAVSRALGDFEYKSKPNLDARAQLVSPEPDVTIIKRNKLDEFIVLACDGIWDELTNEELCSFVRYQLQITDDLTDICNQTLDTCLYKGSRDNMTMTLISLEGAPKVSEAAKLANMELNQRLETDIRKLVADNPTDQIDLPYLMHNFSDFEGLPPGGGVYCRRNLLKAVLQKVNPVDSASDEDNV